MDKNAIKKYAVWARTELITRVSQRAEKYDITAEADASASSVNGVLLSDAEIKQRKALIEQVKQKGFDQVMEEVAYTWFNRFIALRFMEVNGYLPSHIRVFTDDNNNFKPQILAEAIHLELDGEHLPKCCDVIFTTVDSFEFSINNLILNRHNIVIFDHQITGNTIYIGTTKEAVTNQIIKYFDRKINLYNNMKIRFINNINKI